MKKFFKILLYLFFTLLGMICFFEGIMGLIGSVFKIDTLLNYTPFHLIFGFSYKGKSAASMEWWGLVVIIFPIVGMVNLYRLILEILPDR